MTRQQIVILVAEDQPLIRLAIVGALVDEGHEAIEAEHAAEALAILEMGSPTVDILFSDIQMPGEMDGLQLAHRTRAKWPWIGLLLASGRMAPKSHEMPPDTRFLPKPYDQGDVLANVRELARL